MEEWTDMKLRKVSEIRVGTWRSVVPIENGHELEHKNTLMSKSASRCFLLSRKIREGVSTNTAICVWGKVLVTAKV